MISLTNWSSVIDSRDLQLKQRWADALYNYALQALDEQDLSPPPDNQDDALAIYELIAQNAPPDWWPSLGRITASFHWQAEDSNPESGTPIAIETANNGGFRSVRAAALRSFGSIGSPFEGSIRVEFRRRDKDTNLGGISAPVVVDTKRKKKSEEDDGETPREKALWKRLENHDQLMVGALGGVANVVHGAAAVVNAAANLNGNNREEGDDASLEDKLLGIAVNIAGRLSGGSDEDNEEKRDRKRASKVLQDNAPSVLQLTGPDVDFQGPPPEDFELEEEDVVNADWSQVQSFDEDDLEEEEEEETEPEEASGSPLDHLSPEEAMDLVAKYIDDHPEHKGALKRLGSKKLVPKLL